MLSMTLSSLGWGTWWVVLFLRRFLPELEFGLRWPGIVSTVFAGAGLLVALFAVRATRSWMLFVAIPLLANGSLLLVPWLAAEVADGER